MDFKSRAAVKTLKLSGGRHGQVAPPPGDSALEDYDSRPTQKNKWSSPPTISHGESVIEALHQEARLTADRAFVVHGCVA